MDLDKRKKKKTLKPGPVYSKDKIPYDYIVLIDAGSKGSRVYVYNWLNPKAALDAGVDMRSAPKVNLVHESILSNSADEINDESHNAKGNAKKVTFPSIYLDKHWHKKITPGLSSFYQSPQKVGKRHLRYLLSYASAIVPKSQHHRTPIYLHATAGMRLLPPKEQTPILENVCQYLMTNSDFFIPQCKSHVNIIDGDVEGLYGWLSINYLVGAFDWPEEHNHGKEHSTYGLLDMGGASTQVVFQPNSTESKEHENNLYRLSLDRLPQLAKEEDNHEKVVGDFYPPEIKEFNVFSDSFLGFGMFQAQNRFRSILVEQYKKDNDIPEETNYFGTPLSDPCLPKGYTTKEVINHHNVDFTGGSDFETCLTSISLVLKAATHNTGTPADCSELSHADKVSSCLLNDLVPAFDFDVNHFVGVSGYWDAINALSSYGNIPRSDSNSDYDYLKMYEATSQWCSRSFKDMVERNNQREKNERVKEEELALLCFKSSWILNFLHVGLGFPRIGIDGQKDDKFKSLRLVEKVGGLSFSWTLGRAVLYSNDEYVQAFNNYTKEKRGNEDNFLKRPGYYFTPREHAYQFGAEAAFSYPRPQFTPEAPDANYPVFDYEYDYAAKPLELKWYLQTHRNYGGLIFMLMVLAIAILMLGKKGRKDVVDYGKDLINRILILIGLLQYAYAIVPEYDPSTDSYELEEAPLNDFRNEGSSSFAVGYEEEEV